MREGTPHLVRYKAVAAGKAPLLGREKNFQNFSTFTSFDSFNDPLEIFCRARSTQCFVLLPFVVVHFVSLLNLASAIGFSASGQDSPRAYIGMSRWERGFKVYSQV